MMKKLYMEYLDWIIWHANDGKLHDFPAFLKLKGVLPEKPEKRELPRGAYRSDNPNAIRYFKGEISYNEFFELESVPVE